MIGRSVIPEAGDQSAGLARFDVWRRLRAAALLSTLAVDAVLVYAVLAWVAA